MVKLEVGLLSDHLHRHCDEITFKTMGLWPLYFSNWRSYPRVSPTCSVDWHYTMIRYAYHVNALKCADRDFTIFVRDVISAIFKSLHQGQIAIALYFRPAIISTSTVYICTITPCPEIPHRISLPPVIYLFNFRGWQSQATVNEKKPFLPVFWTEFDDVKSVDD